MHWSAKQSQYLKYFNLLSHLIWNILPKLTVSSTTWMNIKAVWNSFSFWKFRACNRIAFNLKKIVLQCLFLFSKVFFYVKSLPRTTVLYIKKKLLCFSRIVLYLVRNLSDFSDFYNSKLRFSFIGTVFLSFSLPVSLVNKKKETVDCITVFLTL